ncbi:hypothetical protein PUNSTDRAFT_128294 [Punctularia strigosozonata HHB-11173 SS5]|uniref:Uncharacterized protein n=1 Tax=Punctularia strigosozonata (strain HHB-11173) TaxID=741275 RepID=R7S2J7_PUNST|nr:uncharacterized protein PUNSTDRAFT_128294 [Punctularia strigosozonata HHB-11173 SS5]EIN04433.1 hypothetical protein PUNSTDRAFT_128294 [Punctularia strigosozonata HHB-11173 SS5]
MPTSRESLERAPAEHGEDMSPSQVRQSSRIPSTRERESRREDHSRDDRGHRGRREDSVRPYSRNTDGISASEVANTHRPTQSHRSRTENAEARHPLVTNGSRDIVDTGAPASTTRSRGLLGMGAGVIRWISTSNTSEAPDVSGTGRPDEASSQLQQALRRIKSLENREKDLTAKLAARDEQYATEVSRLEYQSQRTKGETEQYRSEIARLRADLVQAKEALARRQDVALDTFNVTADQVSEAYLLSSGPYSLQVINNAIDDMVQNILVDYEKLSHSQSHSTSVDTPPPPTDCHPLLSPFWTMKMDSESRGLVLDALLHHSVVRFLEGTVFSFGVVPAHFQYDPFASRIYERLREQEPWSTTQRWKSLSVAGAVSVWKPDFVTPISNAARDIIAAFACASRTTLEFFYPLAPKIEQEIHRICCLAYQLSVAVKRDIVLFLRPVDNQLAELQWDMGAQPGDMVIGDYSLGLTKTTAEGQSTIAVLPKVVTTALLRYADQNQAA